MANSKFRGVLVLLCTSFGAFAQSSVVTGDAPLTARERALLERIDQLEKRLNTVEAKLGVEAAAVPRVASPTPVATAPAVPTQVAAVPTSTAVEGDKSGVLGFVPGSTINFYFDGFYGFNFNHPVGRMNLLRANDVFSNSFTLNQVGLILERAPDVAAGRRFGGRLDLMYGQNTETMQGSSQNELRPQVYRNIFQAYGTYVFPVGSGLTVDFGKFYSSLGYENNYAYDEVNYSRAYFFNYLPYYHMGVRTTYNVNDKLSVQHWLVNGANQTEDFNGFKSNAFLITIKPTKTVAWNVNYYVGNENRDVTSQPSQPTPNGMSHIFDTYASWNQTQKLTWALEFDHVVSRPFANSAPGHVTGGAAYGKYQFTPKFNLAGRFEYLGDHGGLFGGVTQALKESTVTATYQPADGVQMRLEWRRDFSNRPYFLTDMEGVLKRDQNTATLGMIWWFGGKKESW